MNDLTIGICDFCGEVSQSYFFILPWIVDKQATNVHCRVVTTCKQHEGYLRCDIIPGLNLTNGLCKGGPADTTNKL